MRWFCVFTWNYVFLRNDGFDDKLFHSRGFTMQLLMVMVMLMLIMVLAMLLCSWRISSFLLSYAIIIVLFRFCNVLACTIAIHGSKSIAHFFFSFHLTLSHWINFRNCEVGCELSVLYECVCVFMCVCCTQIHCCTDIRSIVIKTFYYNY